MIELKSIEEEAADCYAAFKDSKVGDWAVHIHHGAKCVEQRSSTPNKASLFLFVYSYGPNGAMYILRRGLTKKVILEHFVSAR